MLKHWQPLTSSQEWLELGSSWRSIQQPWWTSYFSLMKKSSPLLPLPVHRTTVFTSVRAPERTTTKTDCFAQDRPAVVSVGIFCPFCRARSQREWRKLSQQPTCIYSASSWSQHTLFTLCHSHQTIIITQSHSSILPTCFTSSLKPASYITRNSSSELLIPLSAIFIWTCRFNLLHSAITFHHVFTVSLWAQKLPFQKILSSTLVSFCLSDWAHGYRPFTGLICLSVLCFNSIFFCFSYS